MRQCKTSRVNFSKATSSSAVVVEVQSAKRAVTVDRQTASLESLGALHLIWMRMRQIWFMIWDCGMWKFHRGSYENLISAVLPFCETEIRKNEKTKKMGFISLRFYYWVVTLQLPLYNSTHFTTQLILQLHSTQFTIGPDRSDTVVDSTF